MRTLRDAVEERELAYGHVGTPEVMKMVERIIGRRLGHCRVNPGTEKKARRAMNTLKNALLQAEKDDHCWRKTAHQREAEA